MAILSASSTGSFTKTVNQTMDEVLSGSTDVSETIGQAISDTVFNSLSNLGFSSPAKGIENNVEGVSPVKMVRKKEEIEGAKTVDPMAAIAALALLPFALTSDGGLQKKVQRMELAESESPKVTKADDNRKVSKSSSEASEVSADSVATLAHGLKIKATGELRSCVCAATLRTEVLALDFDIP